jgi:hypothetical protein
VAEDGLKKEDSLVLVDICVPGSGGRTLTLNPDFSQELTCSSGLTFRWRPRDFWSSAVLLT